MNRWEQILISILLGGILDLLIGDPKGIPHPVVAIGRLIGQLETLLRRIFPQNPRGELWAGALLALLTGSVTLGTAAGILLLAYRIHPYVGIGAESIMCCYMFAARSLFDESMKVKAALDREGLEAGRTAVSMIVGRDTGSLSEEGVLRAAVETVAENTSDGVIAPLLFAAIGGAPLLWLYKAVNTMDSMVGYRNDRYLYFGRCAARLDDLFNLIPSRISALALILAAFLLPGYSGTGAWRIWRRDRRKHKSPNSAQTESAAAGALGLRLAGPASYFGVVTDKPYIGDGIREIERKDILRANLLMLTGTLVVFLAVCAGLVLCVTLWETK